MLDTYANKNGSASRKTAIFYTQSPKDPLGLEPFIGDKTSGSSTGTGFGGGFSTALNLFKFARAYRTGKLLGAEMTKIVAEGKVNADSQAMRRYGYGVYENESNGERLLSHIGGSRAAVQMYWNSGYTVIIQTNAIPPPINGISSEIIDFITKQNAFRRSNDTRIQTIK